MIAGMLFSLLVGWLAGGLANWAADELPAYRQRTLQRFWHTWPHYWSLCWYWRRPGCPRCQESRPLRVPLLEAGMAVVFLITWTLLRSQPSLVIGLAWLYTWFLLVVLVIDFEQRRVLNLMLAPAAMIALLLGVLPGGPDIGSVALGGLVGFGTFLLLYAIGRGRLGAGDVKLAGVIGLMTGYPAVWTALVLGVLLGAAAALVLLLARRATRKSYMAYAPYLALGALITLWETLGR